MENAIDRRLTQMEAEGRPSSGRRERRIDITAEQFRGMISTRWCWRVAPPPKGATCPSRAIVQGHPPRPWVPARGPTGSSRAIRCSTATAGRPSPPKGKRVIIIGGGDTGADCLGTSHRQGAASVHQFEDHAAAGRRADSTPVLTFIPLMFRVSSGTMEAASGCSR